MVLENKKNEAEVVIKKDSSVKTGKKLKKYSPPIFLLYKYYVY